jgi:hypothetical protein
VAWVGVYELVTSMSLIVSVSRSTEPPEALLVMCSSPFAYHFGVAIGHRPLS